MSISPEISIPEIGVNSEVRTSKTFRFDFEENRITSEIISGKAAIEQFIYMALRTARYVHPIYSNQVGNELAELIADETVSFAYKKSEIPRMITDALIYDERIESVYDFKITEKKDGVYIEFKVDTIEGLLTIEEVY